MDFRDNSAMLLKTPMLINSAFSDQNGMQKAGVCGAAVFVSKSEGKDALIRSIRWVLAEEALPGLYRPPRTGSGKKLENMTSRIRYLTERQLSVLQMICQGLLNKQIAHKLDIAETTVKAHVSQILRKLCVVSRTQAVLEVYKFNLYAVLALYEADDDANSILPNERLVGVSAQ